MSETRKITSLIDCGMGVKQGYRLEVNAPVLENVDFETTDVFHMPVLKVLYQDDRSKFRDIGDVVTYAFLQKSKKVIIVAEEDCDDKHLFLEVTFYKEVE